MLVITVARKPLEGSVAANVVKHGCGAMNIDATRIASANMPQPTTAPGWDSINARNAMGGYRDSAYEQGPATYIPSPGGRWPANVILTSGTAEALDAQSGILKSCIAKENKVSKVKGQFITNATSIPGVNQYGDEGGASRFFKVVQC